jgi:SOS-response transcriptional repressor LexA
MTARQQQVLLFIAQRIESSGMSPTYFEIANELSLNALSTAYKHCQRLEKKGLVGIRSKEARGLFLTEEGKAELSRLGERPSFEMEANPTLSRITMTGGKFHLERRLNSQWVLEIAPNGARPFRVTLTGFRSAAVVPVLHEAAGVRT